MWSRISGLGENAGKLRFEKPETSAKFIYVAAILHNYRIDHGEALVLPEPPMPGTPEAVAAAAATASRDAISPPWEAFDDQPLSAPYRDIVFRDWHKKHFFKK